jgi:cyclic-di-GMP phosphodiesterase TipF (flagellum assembly factor)
MVSTRLGVRAVADNQLRDMARGHADMARKIAELEAGAAALQRRLDGMLDKARAATDPLAVELGELGSLVGQLAEMLAAHEARLAELGRPPTGHTAATLAVPPKQPAPPPPPAPVAADNGQNVGPAAPAAAPTLEPMLATIAAAIEANRFDLYLQPIVTLPQRKVRYYEAMSRLRTDKGEVVPAADFLPAAEAAGLMPKIDNLVVFRCVQVIRRLQVKNRDVGLFCNLSGATLGDGAVFPQLLDFLDANRAIAPSLVLEFTQSALRAAGPMENESLAALAERGYRFSLDTVNDLRIEARELAARGFRFVKVNSNFLLHRGGNAPSDIHPADLTDLLGRFGIDLVAEKIESEGVVVDLLDYDLKFGQGFLFSPPRPVRAEALQGIAERADVGAPEAGASNHGAAGGAANGAVHPSGETAAAEAGRSSRASALAQLARRI